MVREDMQRNGQLHQTALRLMRCLGSAGALEYCRDQQWQGLYDLIRMLDGERPTQLAS